MFSFARGDKKKCGDMAVDNNRTTTCPTNGIALAPKISQANTAA
jgi:hypothetical protein